MNNKTNFISSILLKEAIFDIVLLADLLEKEFMFKIDRDKGFDVKNNTFACCIDKSIVTVALMPTKIPNNEAYEASKNNFEWKEATQIANDHKAHVLIVASGDVSDAIDLAILQVLICCCALKQEYATGIFTLKTLIEPENYIENALKSIAKQQLPIFNLVYFGLYKNSEKTTSGYTYGLGNFKKNELEIIDSTKSVVDVFSCLTKISNYLLMENQNLVDGELIGITYDEKLSVKLSKAVALQGETFKIGY